MTAPDERVAQIEARLQAATPGKWETYGPELRSIKRDPWPLGESEFVVLSGFEHGINTGCERPRDAEFIAHAPEDLRLVLDDNKALRDKLAAAVRRAEHFEERFNQMCGRFDEIAARLVVAVRRAETAEAEVQFLLETADDPMGTIRSLQEHREAVASRTAS